MKISTLLLTAVLGIFLHISATMAYDAQNMPPNGFVPDEQTAVRIAEAVWIPIYGEKKIEKEKPFKAVLKEDTWRVTGSLPEGMLGGTAIAEISKKDGRILYIIHQQ
ncbi:MAG: YbbC/YhhH family protein [Alphaproteobacteria bacterium]|nr:YbbC/YhhH family protein [Alphaproteobacteria bacterium]